MKRTFTEIERLVRSALEAKYSKDGKPAYIWVRDVADTWVAFGIEGPAEADMVGTWQADYSIDDDTAEVTLSDPVKVEARTQYEVIESITRREPGRVLEAKGTDTAGGRVFHVRIIEAGDSKNGRRYPLPVLRAGVSLYEGAKAFDHHRTVEELQTSALTGLVGQYHDVSVDDVGIVGDLHLLPSATHVAEALDASLASQEAGGPPIAGISHDVIADWKAPKPTKGAGARRLTEATKIVSVLSADVVADPAAGGKALRMVAGGITLDDPNTNTPAPDEEDPDMSKTLAELLAEATDDDKAALRAMLDDGQNGGGDGSNTDPTAGSGGSTDPGTIADGTDPDDTPAPEPELVGAGARESLAVRMAVREAVASIDGLDVEDVIPHLPETGVTEATITSTLGAIQRIAEGIERRHLTPTSTPRIRVTEEHVDKAREKVYATLCRRWGEGYSSFFDMFEDITGQRLRGDADGAHRVVREAWDAGRLAGRAPESIETGTFAEVLGDSITRRLIDMYRTPRYGTWRSVARTTPVRDFREQKRDRMGGYGNLPEVAQGAPYQPLTSPTDEEATYTISKKGGTEDLTFEAVINDDLGALARIPEALGRAAARTLHEFVWLTLFSSNPTCSYDATALFAAGHANTTAVALSHAGANSLRQKMRDQAEYGVAGKPLGLTPRFLIVPNELEDLAHQICTSARAVPATTPGATDVPNLHEGMQPVVVDEFTDADDWYMVCDPVDLALMEIGFLNGREDPELMMQDDPRVGAVFSSDKVTWKIRHIYSGTILDHRAAQRGTQ